MRSAFAAARGEWVFYTDGDGQYDPFELALLAAQAGEDVDVVQGYKRQRSIPSAAGSSARSTGSWSGGIRPRDQGYRLRLRLIRRLAWRIRSQRSSGAICVELVRKLQMAGARFREVEVSHYERRAGESQFFTPRKVGRALAAVAWLWVSLVAAPALGSVWTRLTRQARPKPSSLAPRERGCHSGDGELDGDLRQPDHDRYGDR